MLPLLFFWWQATGDIHGQTALHIAAGADGYGKTELVRSLLAQGSDPNARDDEGASPLDNAVWRGSLENAVLLLNGGAKLNEPDTKTGATPLNEAVFRGRGAIAKMLLARGADSSIKDHAGFLPAENAIRQHHPELLGILLEHESDHDLPARLLAEAVQRGQVDTVQVLLDLGVKVDARFSSGSTALYEAALKGDSAIVAFLLSRGADVNARETNSRTTPLYAAAAFGRQGVVSALLLWGADPNLVSKDQVSPLHAAESNNFPEIAKQLRAAGAH